MLIIDGGRYDVDVVSLKRKRNFWISMQSAPKTAT